MGWTHFPVFWFLYSWWEDYVQFCCNFRWPDAFSLALLRSSPVSISFHIHSLGLCIFFTNCYINPTYSTIIVSLRVYLMVSFPRPKQISFAFLDSALLSMAVDWGDCSLLPWWGPPISGTAELQLFWGLNWKHDYFLDFWWRKMASVVSFQSPGLLWCYAFFSAVTLHSGMCFSGSVVSLANIFWKEIRSNGGHTPESPNSYSYLLKIYFVCLASLVTYSEKTYLRQFTTLSKVSITLLGWCEWRTAFHM